MKKTQLILRFRKRKRGKVGRPRTDAGAGYMRKQRVVFAIEEAFRIARARFGMRIVHYSIQGNHLHLIVEAEDRESLAKGMQGLAIRIAKTLNRLFDRAGHVWADRYHSHVLRTRREVANALRYVLGNFARHARQWGETAARFADECSSIRYLGLAGEAAPVAAPRTWLLRIGWRSDVDTRHSRR
ncbi:MAG: hypothetical protein E6J88_11555 [Deltaproteobacteria bacterium]|nr:MAG: hypothetical protein E6J88_11555 [Deltaproteobacteria bacterium]